MRDHRGAGRCPPPSGQRHTSFGAVSDLDVGTPIFMTPTSQGWRRSRSRADVSIMM